MGKEGKKNRQEDEPVPITQDNIDRGIESGIAAGELGPQSPAQRAGQGRLGQAVRALVDGRTQTIFLTEFELASESYFGMAVRNNAAEGNETMPKFTPLQGLRPFPYASRPNADFQFVYPGEDESVLINIAHNNIHPRSQE